MNQEQRRFLITKIENTFNGQKDELEEQMPEEPTMNRHVISAFLSGEIKIKDSKKIKEGITAHVRGLKNDGTIITDPESDWNYRTRRSRKVGDYTLVIPPELIIDLPESYKKAREEYDKKKKEVDAKITALTSQKDTLILKIQIGSNSILDKLINQVDSLGDLDLFSNQLSLIAAGVENPQKQISNSK